MTIFDDSNFPNFHSKFYTKLVKNVKENVDFTYVLYSTILHLGVSFHEFQFRFTEPKKKLVKPGGCVER